ncbi:AbrB family transcriptional regulator [uncultured Ferrovibrio sp.]|jgi:membrane AbrB-like protein|uniref:AbrB family transcriptional regulator n=1 Tax=uncultured Ferrovibrio sp. TaxID=1576913 RepID=UPI002628A240|nr:AbrB family transcriptional regulator [uncultured Ferrovibrio sp.]
MQSGIIRGLIQSLPALAIGAAGGVLFLLIRMPLAWMLGSMVFVAAAALLGASRRIPLKVEPRLRALMITILGVMLGSAFKPEMIDRAREWIGLIILMLVYIPVVTGLCYALFRRVVRFDPVTAYFAATPGGLQEMTLVGEHYGGDGRSIILTHAIRIFVVVMTIPVYFRFVEGLNVPSMTPGVHLADMLPMDALLLAACALAGWFGAKLLKVPAAQLVGPMVVSGVVHLLGWSTAQPPPELVAAAQLAMGTALGCRFVGTPAKAIGRIAKHAVTAALIMIGVAVGLTIAFADKVGVPREALILVLSPGGLAEMSLVALALGVEVAIVSSMHVFRIAVVVILAPVAFRLSGLKRKA